MMQHIPLEIIDTIIAHLIQDPSNMESREETLVRNCALVSTGFGALCQSHLFRTISCVGFYEAGSKRLMRLIDTLKENPTLTHYIREVRIGFSESAETRCRSTSPDLPHVSSILLNLPKLQKLAIIDWSYTFGRRIKLPTDVYAFLHQMIDIHLSRGTLRTLNVLGLKDLPISSLTTHASLRELRLGRTSLSYFAVFSPHITALDFYSIDSFDISILSQFPRLEKFSLRTKSLVMTPFPHCGTASPFLRKLKLHLSLPKMTRTLVDFYSGYELSSGVRAFEKLHELEYEVPCNDRLEGLQYILQRANTLKVLEIRTTEEESSEDLQDTDSLLDRIQLSTKILNIFPHLTNLRISLHLTVYPLAYESTLSQAVSLLDSIARRNTIEEFAFILTTKFDREDLPSFRPWLQIGQLLSNPASFPVLRKVEMSLFFAADDEILSILMRSSTGIHEEQVGRIMLETKKALLARGIEFTSNGFLSEW